MSLHINDLRIDILRCAAEHLIAGHYHINSIEFTYVPTHCCEADFLLSADGYVTVRGWILCIKCIYIQTNHVALPADQYVIMCRWILTHLHFSQLFYYFKCSITSLYS
jgi:hypothetical protein